MNMTGELLTAASSLAASAGDGSPGYPFPFSRRAGDACPGITMTGRPGQRGRPGLIPARLRPMTRRWSCPATASRTPADWPTPLPAPARLASARANPKSPAFRKKAAFRC
jgi:hypothetical protein